MNKKVHIFAHLPKTGGTTLRHALETNYDPGTNYFHLAVNGIRNLAAKNLFAYDVLSKKTSSLSYPLILFGHNTNEGLMHYFDDHEFELTTILRHPFSRNVSHYFMKVNGKNLSTGLMPYLRKNKRSMCQFYVSRYPSLVSDPFAPLPDQAMDVLSHFHNVEFLEDAPESLNRVLNVYGMEFNESFNANRSKDIGYQKKLKLDELDDDLHYFLRQDLEFYYTALNYDFEKPKALPANIRKPNYWLKFIIGIFHGSQECIMDIYNSIENDTVRALLHAQKDLKKLDQNQLLKDFVAISNYESLSSEMQYNLFDVFRRIIRKVNRFPMVSWWKRNNYFGGLIRQLNKAGALKVSSLDSDISLSTPEFDFVGLISRSKYYLNKNRIDESLNTAKKACQIYPTDMMAFENLLSISRSVGEHNLSMKCLFKLSELARAEKYNLINKHHKAFSI